jgi:hypothetical protein
MEKQVNAGGEQLFALALKIPSGLSEAEVTRRVHSMLFGLSAAAKTAGVEVVKGPVLERFISAHLTGK